MSQFYLWSAAAAGILIGIPIVHFWLHALLSTWKKFPLAYYILTGLLFLGCIAITVTVYNYFPYHFTVAMGVQWLGWLLLVIAALLVMLSMYTIGFKRFFMLAVLIPTIVDQRRINAGPFKVIPHPAYVGYCIASVGLFCVTGGLHTLVTIMICFTLYPVLMWIESEELNRRLAS